MPVLLVLNGPPGAGKSTLAQRYARDHRLALVLDVDVLRGHLGGWEHDPVRAGHAARRLAVAMARTHLDGGHDVVVAQLVARPGFLERLEEVAEATGATWAEIVLVLDDDEAVRRAAAHPEHTVDAAEAAELRARLADHVRTRPRAQPVTAATGDVEGTYAAVVDRLRAVTGPVG